MLEREKKYKLRWPLALIVMGSLVLFLRARLQPAPTSRDWCDLITPQAEVVFLPESTATAVAHKLGQLATAEAQAGRPGNPECLSTKRPIRAITVTPTPNFFPPELTPATG